MQRVLFSYDLEGEDAYEDILEFEDDLTDAQIQENFDVWLEERVTEHAGWYYI